MRFLFLLGYCLVKYFNNIIQFSSIFLLTKQVLLKTIVIVAGKLTRSRVLRGGPGFRVAQGAGMGQENFPHHARRVRDGVRQNHADGGEDPILRTHLAPLPSLVKQEQE